MKTLFLILLLTVGIYAQPPLNTYEFVSRNDSTVFSVKKNPRLLTRTATFTMLMARIKEENPGINLVLNPLMYMEYNVVANCRAKTLTIINGTGIWNGLPHTDPKQPPTKPKPGSPLYDVVVKVCKLDTFL